MLKKAKQMVPCECNTGGGGHSNGHNIGFHSQTQKLELHTK